MLIPILSVVAVLLVVGIYFATRKKNDGLPPGSASEQRQPEAEVSRPASKPTQKPKKTAKDETPEAEPSEAKPSKAEPKPSKADPTPSPETKLESEPSVTAPEPEPEPPTKPAPRKANPEEVAALRDGLGSTRGGFMSKLKSLFRSRKVIDPELLEEMEELLITADIGVTTTDKILARLRTAMEEGTISDADAAWAALRGHAQEILARPGSGALSLNNTPTVILVIGVNGAGKTTTIGKLASRLKADGKSVILAAGDTFRAAAVLQLEVWGRRVGCEVVKGKDRADPGSVIYSAIEKGKEMGVDIIIADTAGRLHTKTPLMDELQKVGRTANKALGRPVDEILLVLDATTGQNATQQVAQFKEALPISGLVLTKLDGTAKGGVIMGIVDSHDLPVRYVGIGERIEDLKEFDPSAFVEALFDSPEEASE